MTLQSGVARILREIGLTVEENKLVATPRGLHSSRRLCSGHRKRDQISTLD